jgi:hypothetical protein
MTRHRCYQPKDTESAGGFGDAIERCDEDEEGRFVVDNGEYASFVRFCPYCGAKAPADIPTAPPAVPKAI